MRSWYGSCGVIGYRTVPNRPLAGERAPAVIDAIADDRQVHDEGDSGISFEQMHGV
jgi:hypothetical protein